MSKTSSSVTRKHRYAAKMIDGIVAERLRMNVTTPRTGVKMVTKVATADSAMPSRDVSLIAKISGNRIGVSALYPGRPTILERI